MSSLHAQALRAALADLSCGKGGAVTLEGDAGIGKTQLLYAMREMHAEDFGLRPCVVLESIAAQRVGRGERFFAWQRIFRRLLTDEMVALLTKHSAAVTELPPDLPAAIDQLLSSTSHSLSPPPSPPPPDPRPTSASPFTSSATASDRSSNDGQPLAEPSRIFAPIGHVKPARPAHPRPSSASVVDHPPQRFGLRSVGPLARHPQVPRPPLRPTCV